MKRIEYEKGEKIGDLIYICELPKSVASGGSKTRYAKFMCGCGRITEARIGDVKYGKVKGCVGCRTDKSIDRSFKHGITKTNLYKKWADIKTRCYNTKSTNYYKYGARGIKMSDEFRNDPVMFIEYVKGLEDYDKEGYSIDRIDNDGDYRRGNLRWTTQHFQTLNQRKLRISESGYVGVYKRKNRHCSLITLNNKRINFGSFRTVKGALCARNKYIIDNGLVEYEVQEYIEQ